MDLDLLLKTLIAVAPVLVLLFVFDRLDVFNLITFRVIATLVLAGAALSVPTFLLSAGLLGGFPIGFSDYSKYVAPVIEESLKAAPIVWLFYYNRLGYKLDAGIAGFAVGAGFSVAENLLYLHTQLDANITAWLVRGAGTAIMHGGATGLFAVISHELTERQAETAAAHYRFNPLLFAPGLGLAVLVHGTFNHFPDQPAVTMALTLLLIPMLLFFTFARSEHATNKWLADDAETHRRALEELRAGQFADSDDGKALQDIAKRFHGGAAVADVLAFVELKTELILRAEEIILAVQSGQPLELSPDDREKFMRLDAIEHRLGRTVLAAIAPRLSFTRNDLWELSQFRSRVFEG